MSDKFIEALVSLGINEKQAKVYLALIELGEATVQEIAKSAELNRTTVGGGWFISAPKDSRPVAEPQPRCGPGGLSVAGHRARIWSLSAWGPPH